MSSISSPLYFNGLSTYSSDLNNVISRTVQIAALPIQVLSNDVTTLTNQSNELSTINNDFSSIQSAISSLASATGNMLSASVSNSSVATATLGAGATEGTYTVAVTNLGSYSNALSDQSLTKVTDPSAQNISASGSYTLTVNGVAFPTTLTATTLTGLAKAINDSGADVQATVVNVGSNSAPDYRLSLQSSQLGNVTMQLSDGSHDLLDAGATPGTPAQYTVNGQPITSDSDTVTLAPGVTLNLTGETTGNPATVTVAPNTAGVASALQSFVSSYNAAMTELGRNIGQSGGALSGQSVVYQLTNALQGLATFRTGNGNLSSMAALGITFNDNTGRLSFDPSAFSSATSGQIDALTTFLGSATGGGFIGTATNLLLGINDPATGTLTNQINSVQTSITRTNTQITNEENQVAQLQASLTQQMAAADAMIYGMQQQASQIQNILTAQEDSLRASG